MARCVIVSGAPIGDYSRIRRYLRLDDFFVFCDGGLRHRAGLQAEADLIVGDFDSHEKPAGGAEIIALPREKDDTDRSLPPGRQCAAASATSCCWEQPAGGWTIRASAGIPRDRA